MKTWLTFTQKFGARRKTLQAQYETTEAYRRVFQGHPQPADQQMVLAHLAACCGKNTYTPPNVASKELWFREGKKAAFAELFGHLALSHDDMAAFENAVKREVAFNQQDAQGE